MAELTVLPITKAGIADVTAGLVAAGAAGDTVKSATGIFIYVANGDASPHTLTVARPKATVNYANLGSLAVEDITLVVAAGDAGVVAVPAGYAANGSFEWTYDAVTSVTVGVMSVAP